WMPGFRYIVPLVPLLWLLCTLAALQLLGDARREIAPRTIAVAVAVLPLCSLRDGRALGRAVAGHPTGAKPRVWVTTPDRVAVARQLAALVPAGSTLAIGECGFVPYYTPELRYLDVFGLMDPEIARLPGPHLGKLTLREFLRRDPRYYLMMSKR